MKSRYSNKPKEKYYLFGPDPQGFEVLFEENYPQSTLHDLLQKFYYHNHYDTTPVRPISTHLEVGTEMEQGWYFFYYQRYYIFIEKHYQSSHGPHIARLQYKAQYANRAHWIATLQIGAFFFSEEELLTHLYVAIRDRKFYITEQDGKRTVIL